jgi:hypothetical protein
VPLSSKGGPRLYRTEAVRIRLAFGAAFFGRPGRIKRSPSRISALSKPVFLAELEELRQGNAAFCVVRRNRRNYRLGLRG